MEKERQKIAFFSVWDKIGIIELARVLITLGWKIVSSGGTAKHLKKAGILVTTVLEFTGMDEILGHRVVTLHPKVHGGLLARDTPEDWEELKKNGIEWIDMVVNGLYPLEDEINNPNATKESIMEKTDMGGVALIRSAIKGGRPAICDTNDYALVIEWLEAGQPDSENFINSLNTKSEWIVSHYCGISAAYHSGGKYFSFFWRTG